MNTKTAIVTGAFGQDGQLLCAHLCDLKYNVVGIVKEYQLNNENYTQLEGVRYTYLDLNNQAEVSAFLDRECPNEIYHLSAHHHSSQEVINKSSMPTWEAMVRDNFSSTQTLAFALARRKSTCHMVYAGSSQMFTPTSYDQLVDETSIQCPSTFYGQTKCWSRELLGLMRTTEACVASTAILFNHESHLRKLQFVSRKITKAAALAKRGTRQKLALANIGARVDWSSAQDIVRALHIIASSDFPGDYVLASGVSRSVRDFLDIAFQAVGLAWQDFVNFEHNDCSYNLVGDKSKMVNKLNWSPKISFEDMVIDMVKNDIKLLANE